MPAAKAARHQAELVGLLRVGDPVLIAPVHRAQQIDHVRLPALHGGEQSRAPVRISQRVCRPPPAQPAPRLGLSSRSRQAWRKQAENQSIQRRCRAVESLAAIDILDLDDPTTAPPDSVDRLDPVTPVANELGFYDLRHGSPAFPLWLGD